MQCHDFDERMQGLLDERRPAHLDPQLLAHARACAECRLTLRAQEMLLRTVDRSTSPEPTGGFAERVVSRLDARSSPRALRGRYWLAGGTLSAIAATALLAVAILRYGSPNSEPVQSAPERLVQDGALDLSPARGADRQKSSGAESSDTHEQSVASSDSTTGRVEVESLQDYSEALQSLASRVPQAVERLDEVEEATPGLRPVRTSFSLALGTIRRTMPPQRKSPPPRKPDKEDRSELWVPDGHFV